MTTSYPAKIGHINKYVALRHRRLKIGVEPSGAKLFTCYPGHAKLSPIVDCGRNCVGWLTQKYSVACDGRHAFACHIVGKQALLGVSTRGLKDLLGCWSFGSPEELDSRGAVIFSILLLDPRLSPGAGTFLLCHIVGKPARLGVSNRGLPRICSVVEASVSPEG